MTCSYCHKGVRNKNRIFCSYCKVYCHLSCAFLKSVDLEKVNNNWMCATCFISIFPFTNVDEFEFKNAFSNIMKLFLPQVDELIFNPLTDLGFLP